MEISDVLNNLPPDMRSDLETSLGGFENINSRFKEVVSPALAATSPNPASTLLNESSFTAEELEAIMSEPKKSAPTPGPMSIPETEFTVFEEIKTEAAPTIRAEALAEFEPIAIEELKLVKSSDVVTSITIDVLTSLETKVLELKAAELEAIPVASELRFSGATWYEKVKTLSTVIVGAGGIGSWTAVLLAKMGMSILIIDKDTFDEVNIAGQIFNVKRSNRRNKAVEVATFCTDVVPTARVRGYDHMLTPSNIGFLIDKNSKICICAVDNMLARKLVFDYWCDIVNGVTEEERQDYLFIDGRLAAESYQLYCIEGPNQRAKDRYIREFFSDDEADELSCSFKQTAYMAALLAGRIANNIANFASPKDGIPRVAPFFIEYDAFGFEKVILYA